MAKKTTCPITRVDFRTKAKPVKVVINGVEQEAEVKEFSTGSLGWYLNAKISLDMDGVPRARADRPEPDHRRQQGTPRRQTGPCRRSLPE